jgi:hypothetical protein
MKLRPVRTNALLLFSVLFILCFFSCHKTDLKTDESVTDPATASFFKGLTTSSPQVARVAEALKKQGNGSDLLTSIVKKYGHLKWEKSIVVNPVPRSATNNRTTGTDTIVIIPIVEKDSAVVKAYIKAHIGDSVTLDLFTSNKYSKLPFSNTVEEVNEAEKYAIRFMLLNKEVFGYTEFLLTDNRLFSKGVKNNIANGKRHVSLMPNVAKSNVAVRMQYTETCVNITSTNYHCGTPDAPVCNDADGCDFEACPYDVCYPYTSTQRYCVGSWYDDGTGEGGVVLEQAEVVPAEEVLEVAQQTPAQCPEL